MVRLLITFLLLLSINDIKCFQNPKTNLYANIIRKIVGRYFYSKSIVISFLSRQNEYFVDTENCNGKNYYLHKYSQKVVKQSSFTETEKLISPINIDKLISTISHSEYNNVLSIFSSKRDIKGGKIDVLDQAYLIIVNGCTSNQVHSDIMKQLKALRKRSTWNPRAQILIVLEIPLNERSHPQILWNILYEFKKRRIVNVTVLTRLIPKISHVCSNEVFLDASTWFPYHQPDCITGNIFIKSVGKFKMDENASENHNLINNLFPEKLRGNLNQCELKIATKVFPPYIQLSGENGSSSDKRYVGLEPYYAELITRALGLKLYYMPTPPEDYSWGELTDSGKWIGLLGDVKYNGYDMAMCAFFPKETRSQYFDQTFPSYYEEMVWLVPIAGNASSLYIFKIIFPQDISLATLVAIVAMTVALWLIDTQPTICDGRGDKTKNRDRYYTKVHSGGMLNEIRKLFMAINIKTSSANAESANSFYREGTVNISSGLQNKSCVQHGESTCVFRKDYAKDIFINDNDNENDRICNKKVTKDEIDMKSRMWEGSNIMVKNESGFNDGNCGDEKCGKNLFGKRVHCPCDRDQNDRYGNGSAAYTKVGGGRSLAVWASYVWAPIVSAAVAPRPCHFIQRSLFSLWLMVSLILGVYFQSRIISVFRQPLREVQVSTAEDIIRASLRVEWVEGSECLFYAADPVNAKIIRRSEIQADLNSTLTSVAHRRDTATVATRAFANHIIFTQFRSRSGEALIFPFSSAITTYNVVTFMQKGHPLLERIDRVIQAAAELGLREKWWRDSRREIILPKRESDDARPLALDHIITAGYALALGYLLALVAFLGEIVLARRVPNSQAT